MTNNTCNQKLSNIRFKNNDDPQHKNIFNDATKIIKTLNGGDDCKIQQLINLNQSKPIDTSSIPIKIDSNTNIATLKINTQEFKTDDTLNELSIVNPLPFKFNDGNVDKTTGLKHNNNNLMLNYNQDEFEVDPPTYQLKLKQDLVRFNTDDRYYSIKTDANDDFLPSGGINIGNNHMLNLNSNSIVSIDRSIPKALPCNTNDNLSSYNHIIGLNDSGNPKHIKLNDKFITDPTFTDTDDSITKLEKEVIDLQSKIAELTTKINIYLPAQSMLNFTIDSCESDGSQGAGGEEQGAGGEEQGAEGGTGGDPGNNGECTVATAGGVSATTCI